MTASPLRGLIRSMLSRVERIARHNTEPIEFLMGAMSIQVGAWLLIPWRYDLIFIEEFRAILSARRVYGVALILVGVLRLIALILGNQVRARAVIAFFSCIVWTAIAILFRAYSSVAPVGPVFFSLSVASAWVLLRLKTLIK